MSPLEVTESQIVAQVRSILEKDPTARAIGIRSVGPWRGGETLVVGDRNLRVSHCKSPLAFRERLVAVKDSDEISVLLTPLDNNSLGQDVLARLWRQQLIAIQSWRIVRDLFGVDEIDARLVNQSWMADALLNAQPPAGYPPVPGRALTSEFAWQLLLKRYLGFEQSQVDAIELARWAKGQDRVETYLRAPPEFRASLPDWIAQSAGAVGRVMLHALEQGHGRDLLPLGLACQVVFDPALTDESDLKMAATRLEERYLDGKPLPPETGRGWGAAVASVMEADIAKRQWQAIQSFQRQAEVILVELKADAFIDASPLLPKGFERRLERVAQGILKAISANPGKKALEVLESSVQSALDHRMAAMKPQRAEGLQMATRLVRWLGEPSRQRHAGSFHEAALAYFNDGGFVDWARARIWDGDSNPALADAYGQLSKRVDAQRELENKQFGGLIQHWCRNAEPSSSTLWVEDLLDRVVAPLAKERPSLLLVLDGMSVAVFRELLQDLHMQGWVELGFGEDGQRRPVVAALPTRTEISRASLLCGQLTSGNSAKEKELFRQHEGLRATGRSNHPPTLYHKAELTVSGGRGLSPEVRADIAGTDRRVIGVVINTVDDNLAKSGQFKETWTTETIVPLGQVLDAARESNRILILTSDHGHVLERDMEYRAHEESQERSRSVNSPIAPDEVTLQGPRLWPPGEKVIAPWSEKVRYGIKKYGYHGGVSPQEVVVPLAVLHSGSQDAPSDWVETTSLWPEWWEHAEPEHQKEPVMGTVKPRKGKSANAIGGLFAGLEDELEHAPEPSAPPAATGGWIDQLLTCCVYQEQKQMGARTALDDDRVRRFLEALDARGGRMTRAAMARTLDIPRMRFPGILAALRRLLNVDGYSILDVDENSDMVSLDKRLLFTQFEIKDQAG
ncbi:MAG: BREX-2 system phosphatase PglZ [Magnetococcales bacterium]|nr:BREX-2 system phosphatase PglZ [Magnetococcales bacterium]MBF0149119.1 BREX-2 system phosphatase PglZ [Magnetococcales bacterium]MBF0182077.1 BREX-2 system phosphatase PglZ [Magnetococcales bacterium]MBF0632210.1 BREX-2 system phosphatase PglZ [Magnetococcales bacterium]